MFEFGEFRRRAAQLADEFLCARDVPGMVASVSALRCSAFHDELVSILLRASLDRKESERQAVVSLLVTLGDAGLLSASQISRGFEKLVLNWSDLQLDVPAAPGLLVALLSSQVGLLDKSLFARLPEGLLSSLCDHMLPGRARETVQAHLEDLVAFKSDLSTWVESVFGERSGDAFAAWLRAKNKPAFHHEVVLSACLGSFGELPSADAYWTSCFDAAGLRNEKCRLALAMLARLHGSAEGWLLSDADLQLGFSRLLGAVSNQGSMTQEVLEQLVALLRGAVEHELLPAQFLKIARRLRFGGPRAVDALRRAQRETPLHSRRVWGSGDARQFQQEIRDTISEYFDSKSTEELAQVIEELHLSGKEQATFLRKLLVAGMELGQREAALDVIQELLGYCWSEVEVRDAFDQLRDVAGDLVLDLPYIREWTTQLVAAAERRGLVDKAYLVHDNSTMV